MSLLLPVAITSKGFENQCPVGNGEFSLVCFEEISKLFSFQVALVFLLEINLTICNLTMRSNTTLGITAHTLHITKFRK